VSGARLSYQDTIGILERLGPTATEIVLIGGQAVHFWVNYYATRDATLTSGAPFTSKDVDFCGDARQARAAAEALGGTASCRTLDDATPNTGLVTFTYGGEEHEIDFLDRPHGIERADVERMAITVRTSAEGSSFRVLSPVLCMESRVCNTSLAGYTSEHALRQLRASIICAREFLTDLAAAEDSRSFLRLCERVFHFARGNRRHPQPKGVFDEQGIDPFAAVPRTLPVDVMPGTPPLARLTNFYARRLPRMEAILAADRDRRRRDRERRALERASNPRRPGRPGHGSE
jgi:hypothetical protein